MPDNVPAFWLVCTLVVCFLALSFLCLCFYYWVISFVFPSFRVVLPGLHEMQSIVDVNLYFNKLETPGAVLLAAYLSPTQTQADADTDAYQDPQQHPPLRRSCALMLMLRQQHTGGWAELALTSRAGWAAKRRQTYYSVALCSCCTVALCSALCSVISVA